MNSILGGDIGYNAYTRKEINQLKVMNDFDFEERCIGTFVDGKPLYRKMIDFGYLASNELKTYDTEIANVATAYVNLGKSFWYIGVTTSFEKCITYSFVYEGWIGNIYTSLAANNTLLVAIRSTHITANEYKAVICVEYTKTTD